MASQILLLSLSLTAFFAFSLNPQYANSDGAVELPVFIFSWRNDEGDFEAGDIATINVRVIGNYDKGKYEFEFSPYLIVNDKIGNSSFITGVSLHLDGGIDDWRITFSPLMVGLFDVLIVDDHFRIFDSSLHFQVNPGKMYPAAGILSWGDGADEFVAGTRAEVFILPRDAFGNEVTSTSEGSRDYTFSLSATTSDGIPTTLLNTSFKGWNEQQYLCLEFIAATAGSLLLHVETENQTLHGSPLPFMVHPGKLDISHCEARLKVETKHFQLFSKMEGLIHQHDQYGNLVSGSYEFDLEVFEKGTNLSMPLSDLLFRDVALGTQSFSFTLYEPGNFTLIISDKEKNTLISNTPYDFTVYIGYCDGVNSIVNGSGLNSSVVGETAKFSIFLRDAYWYPSQVQLEYLRVHIMQVSDSQIIQPRIQIRASNGSFSSGKLNHGVIATRNNINNNWNFKASDFDVSYKSEKSGLHEMHVFCGNIALNGGRAFRKEVTAGSHSKVLSNDVRAVNVSLSGVVRFSEKVAKMVKNDIVVRLVDSYSNPVLLQESHLRLEIASINKSAFSTWDFADNNNGLYTVKYLANDIGTYELCASYKGERFVPCPFGVHVYNYEYFPVARNDTASIWEDEALDFDVMRNDSFSGANATIVEYSKPRHGSLLLYGSSVFRYTPYKDFYGNDDFSYTMSDSNGNLASAAVGLLIVCRPPHFASIPSSLQAVEEGVSPTFGGFNGFEVTYSDLGENISVTLSSKSGTVQLSPTQVQFWRPNWDKLSVHKKVDELKLIGCIDVVNSALQSIQYSGNHDFYGDDMITLYSENSNGRNDINVPIFVQPVNDAPVINAPSFVVLNDTSDGVQIFRENSAGVHDPDLQNFPGNHSRFLIVLTMEVSDGFLSTSLPAELVASTELKMKSSYQWQPLQTFVTISKHFMVRAKGIRFMGAIEECNSILQKLSYHEGQHGAVLTLTVNDLGNHGCYPNCDQMMSTPLFAESTVNLVRYKPMSSLAAHILGSAIVVESILVISLGLLLLYFICKCAVVLAREKRRRKAKEIELSKLEHSSKENLDMDASKNEM
ncbi:protein GAMETE EXPRESSED 2-like isoform X1 [Salvia splendens]|uniref:protein GAMETE EXPRESSED 2-like isoform X1 n=1 Tax=Salvia splendens TaxID=180675 RepID=UPI001C27B17C|nr:protein GAMETE EXPRESSED 2-like isoform X1 [Salvia splendens]